MNRSKKFMYNAIASAAYQVIVMLIGFITPRLMLVAYGSEINGMVSSVTQFVSYFNLVQAGLSGAAIFALYRPLAEEDYDDISSILTATANFYYKSGILFSALLTMLAILYPMFIKTSALNSVNISILIFAIGFNSIIDFFLLAKYSALLTADQKNYILSIGSIVSVVINFVIVVVMTYLRVNIVLLKLIAISSVMARSIILYVYCYKRYSYIDYHATPNYEALSKRWSAFYLQLLQVIQKGAPAVLLTFMAKLSDVSIFSIFNMVITGLSGLLDIFISGLSASFGDVITRGEQKTLQRAYKDFEFAYYGMITIVYSIAFVLIMPFIRIYTDGIIDANYNQPILGALSVINAYLYNIKTPQGMLVISAGLYKETRWQSTIQVLLIVIPGMILTPILGIAGIILALMISNLYRDIDLILYIPKTVTKLPVWYSIKNLLISNAAFLLSVFCMSFLITEKMSDYFEWALYSVLTVVVVALIWCIIAVTTNKLRFLSAMYRVLGMIYR